MATPMSASLRARASLTPSPVIATTWPRRCSAPHEGPLLLGRHPAEHAVLSPATAASASGSSGSVPRVDRHRRRTLPGRPTCAATAPTVRGLSPEITFSGDALLGEVPQRLRGVGADPLGAARRAPPGRTSVELGRPAAPVAAFTMQRRRRAAPGAAPAGPRRRARRPWSGVAADAIAWARAAPSPGAPSTQVPRPSHADRATTFGPRRTGHRPAVASAGLGELLLRSPRTWRCVRPRRRQRASACGCRPRRHGRRSSHAGRTRCRRGSACPSCRGRPRRRGPAPRPRAAPARASADGRASARPTMNARLVSSTSPSGTMPTRAGDRAGDGLLPARRCPWSRNWLHSRNGPTTSMMSEIQRSRVLVPATSSECASWNRRASAASFVA